LFSTGEVGGSAGRRAGFHLFYLHDVQIKKNLISLIIE